MSETVRYDEVAEGVFRAAVPLPPPLSSVNCYLLTVAGSAILVDTACAQGWGSEHIPLLLARAGIRASQVVGIVITHFHVDHVGHIRDAQSWFDAPVYAHPAERTTNEWASASNVGQLTEWLRTNGVPDQESAAMLAALRRPSTPVPESAVPLLGGEELALVGSSWRVIHTPGHTPGHLCLYRAADGVLLSGDHLLPNESPNISSRPGQQPDPLGRYLDALAAIRDLDPSLVLAGHGEPSAEAGDLVERQLKHHRVRLADALKCVRTKTSSTYEVALSIPWVSRRRHFLSLDPLRQFFALGEALAHLEYLETRGQIRRTLERDRATWWV